MTTMMLSRTAACLFFGIASAGCVSQGNADSRLAPPLEDQLLGCYAQNADGIPTLEVLTDGGVYYLRSLEDPDTPERRWRLQPRQIPTVEIAKADPDSRIEAMLVVEQGVLGVARVDHPGSANHQGRASEFVFIAPQVGGTIYRQPCP